MHITAPLKLPYERKGVPGRPEGRGYRPLWIPLAVVMMLMMMVVVVMLVVLEKRSWPQSRAIYRRARTPDAGGQAAYGAPPLCDSTRPKRILIWTSFWRNTDGGSWEKLLFSIVSRQCPYSNCELVYDHRNIDSADAILFHAIDFLNTTALPSHRRHDQPWVLLSLEAPPVVEMVDVDYGRLNGLINWTMTYRRDSDVYVPYGRVLPRRDTGSFYEDTQLESPDTDAAGDGGGDAEGGRLDYADYADGGANDGADGADDGSHGADDGVDGANGDHGGLKGDRDYWSEKDPDRMVTWMVSHCATDGRREWFTKELVNHIKVDVYGRCGHKRCGKNISIKTLGSFDQDACNQEINQYFFYLAFENAICDDYVTEKFFMALQLDVIPVVFGGADYASIAPPRSYINALEFTSPKALAQVLLGIAANRTLYNSFFEWKQHYIVELGHPFQPMVCDLCSKLHGAPGQYTQDQRPFPASPEGLLGRSRGYDPSSGSYPDIRSWFVDGSSCRRWWSGPDDYRKHHDGFSVDKHGVHDNAGP